jgi:hypothetical protein
MFRIKWLLNSQSFLLVMAYNVVLFAISFFLLKYQIGSQKLVLALKIPLLSSTIFYVLYRLFKLLYKRNPENTFWEFTGRPIQDVVFTILFWVLGVGLPFVLVKLLSF